MNFIKDYHNPNSLYINKENKWLWLRIHKTAGTSMYDGFLYKHCINISKRTPNYNRPTEAKKWIDNMDNEKLKDYFIWTFVRNPYDRFNSIAGMFSSDANKFARGFDVYSQNNMVFRHSRPQHIFVHDNTNFIGRFENLQEDFDILCNKLDLPITDLKKLNTSRHGDWKEEFDRDTLDFVNGYYKKDFERFNYEML